MSIVLFVTVGGVILLRPITKKLGTYLEVLAEERRAPRAVPPPPDDTHVIAALESLDRRLARIEERQDFTDQLLTTRQTPQIGRPGSE